MSDVRFDASALCEEARGETGLSDFGPDDFRAGLHALCETYDANPFHVAGRARNRKQVLRWLVTRLRIVEALRRHPEIASRPISRPWFLTGMPRSGTSALFNLLAAHPAARALLNWEARIPEPLAGLAPGEPDPRRAALAASYARGREANREFATMHFADVDTPEECALLLCSSFQGVQTGVEVMLEPYASFFRDQPRDALYAWHRTLVQVLDWQRPGDRWLLKTPAHLWGLEALLAAYPDARVVWSHRDPTTSIASLCSLTHLLMRAWMEVDPKWLGPRVLEFYALSLERGLAARERCDPARFADVHHDAIAGDPVAVAERLHRHFDQPFDAAARDAIAAWAAAHPKGKHGEHRYQLEDYGLTERAVRERFAFYDPERGRS